MNGTLANTSITSFGHLVRLVRSYLFSGRYYMKLRLVEYRDVQRVSELSLYPQDKRGDSLSMENFASINFCALRKWAQNWQSFPFYTFVCV
jgi:hypothetical protein